MSTGADCWFQEIEPGKWIYNLQQWPYGAIEDYDRYGPFPSFRKAREHLDNNHANPGGWSTQVHPNHIHEWVKPNWPQDATGRRCDSCWAEEPA